MHPETLITSVALIGALGLGAQWVGWRLQVPSIVLMALAGLIVGPLWAAIWGEALLDPQREFDELLRPMVSLAVAVILFEGGLALKFQHLTEAGPVVRRLVFFGGPIAWFLGSLAAHYIAGLDWASAVVLGGVLIVTGPTVIMPLLRQSKIGGKTGTALKWEGIVNDPVGALFAVAAFEMVRVASLGDGILAAGFGILVAATLGTVMGVSFGWGMARAFRAGWAPEFLKAPLIFGSVVLCYALSEMIESEIGLVAVTAYGMTLANSRLAGLAELQRFKENIAVLLVSGVFVVLTASLTPAVIASAFTWQTLGFVLAMLLIVRPLSVWISTYSTVTRNEAIFLGWIAPRGIVAVAVAGLFGDLLADLSETSEIAITGAAQVGPLAFAMVFATVLLHGFSIRPVARLLGLARDERPGLLIVGANAWSLELAKTLKATNIDVVVASTNWHALRPLRAAGIETYFGEVLAEDSELKLDHTRFDSVAAVTDNDPYNALVCNHFATELGRQRVFQFSVLDTDDEDSRDIGRKARGRTIIRNGRGYDALNRELFQGKTFSRTRLTKQYTRDLFLADRPEADMVAEVRPDGTFMMLGTNRPVKGGDGAVVISFGPEVAPHAVPD
jgi:NhaP-type Na+/H+ or K+/H+ antiporter